MKYYYSYNTTIGKLIILEEDSKITAINIDVDILDAEYFETELIKKTIKEVLEYLSGSRISFDIEIQFKGTECQKSVWKVLSKIPYGETLSYKDIAEKINNPKGYRAVGNACNKNPLLILIPCHRVLGKDKSLTGFALGVDIKEKLLKIEAEQCMKN